MWLTTATLTATLKTAAQLEHLSIHRLAKKAGIAPARLHHIFAGTKKPWPAEIEKLAVHLPLLAKLLAIGTRKYVATHVSRRAPR